MSDYGNRPPDEPTRAYTPVTDDSDATRLERPIDPYREEYNEVPATVLPPGYHERHTSFVAPLVTVGLLCILIGIGLGYLLFHNSSVTQTPAPVTTTTAAPTTTESTETPPFTNTTTSTTQKATTTSSAGRSTATTAKSTSTTAHSTSSTSSSTPSTTSTTKP